jgi:ankyrin repeat protein
MESSADALRLLVEHGGDLSRCNALHAAAVADPEEEQNPAARNDVIACLLREYGMDINALSTWNDGAPRGGKNVSGTPLHRAIQVNNASTTNFLLRSGADRYALNVLGSSCVAYAEEYGSDEIKELLRLPN